MIISLLKNKQTNLAHPQNPLQHRPHPTPSVSNHFHPNQEHFHVPATSFQTDNRVQKRVKVNTHPIMECRDTHRVKV